MRFGILLTLLLPLILQSTELTRTDWNLMSVCQDINSSDLDLTDIQEIQAQNGQTIYTGEYAGYSNLEMLSAGYGYWVKGTVGSDFDGGASKDAIVQPLSREGWNLMAACEDISVEDINMTDIQEIQNQLGKSLYTGMFSEYSNLERLENGYGYWVRGEQGSFFYAKSADQSKGLQTVSNEVWDTLAVRKVLHTFAYGGHATDSQIKVWADMSPQKAIDEMLRLETQNLRLSPAQGDENLSDLLTLTDIGNFMHSKRDGSIYFDVGWATPSDSSLWRNWGASVMLRGLNPFLAKLGLWETNYHMSANQKVVFYSNIMYAYYDDVLQAHQQNHSYDTVMAKASWSHAISKQYGFSNTRYFPVTDSFGLLNEDFAREYHQLFFVNLGEYNPTYHEEVTIKNTAKALTGLTNCYSPTRFLARCEPDSEYHYTPALEILNQDIMGEDIRHKMNHLSEVAIQHEESLRNLPVYIISSWADDLMDEATKERVRTTWQTLESKNFLSFIKQYAISTDFHKPSRIKYQSSIDRSVQFWNKLITDNEAIYLSDYMYYFLDMGLNPFYLKHNVFGHETGLESINSPYTIAKALTGRIVLYDFYCRTAGWKDGEVVHHKKWSHTIPPNTEGKYTKEYVVKWLWNHLIADGLKNYGLLERAHLLALINGKDLGYFLDSSDPTRVYSEADLEEERIQAKLNATASEEIDVDSRAYDVNRAFTFIGATPYVFIEEGQ